MASVAEADPTLRSDGGNPVVDAGQISENLLAFALAPGERLTARDGGGRRAWRIGRVAQPEAALQMPPVRLAADWPPCDGVGLVSAARSIGPSVVHSSRADSIRAELLKDFVGAQSRRRSLPWLL
jgi:hypothetical protein